MAISIWKYPDLEIKDKRLKLLDSQKYFTFDDEISVTGLQPYSLEILGEKFSISSWREFFTKTITILYSLDRKKINQLIDDVDFHGNNTKIIARKKKNCRKAYEILKNELYVEVNLSANSILNYTKLIFEKVSLDNSDIKFWIK